MGRPKLPPRHFMNIAVSDDAYRYLCMKKGFKEPMYKVVDRILQLYIHSKAAEQEETIDKQRTIINHYFNRIKQLEADKQTKLI